MSPEILLQQLGDAIENRVQGVTTKYHLVWLENKMQCIATDCSRHPEVIFGTYSDHQLTIGFTFKEWNKIRKKIMSWWSTKRW